MANKLNKLDKAIKLIQDNFCMINGLCTEDELKLFGGDFASYLETCLIACRRAKQATEHSSDNRKCITCEYFGACGDPSRLAICIGYKGRCDQ